MGADLLCANPSVGDDTLGAILMQNDEKPLIMQPIYFANRMMTSVEKGYNHSEQMFLALMISMTKSRSYLLLKKFVNLTLEMSFPIILQHVDVTSRIAKWVLRLQEFEYTI